MFVKVYNAQKTSKHSIRIVQCILHILFSSHVICGYKIESDLTICTEEGKYLYYKVTIKEETR